MGTSPNAAITQISPPPGFIPEQATGISSPPPGFVPEESLQKPSRLRTAAEAVGNVGLGALKGATSTGRSALELIARPIAKVLGGDIGKGDEASRIAQEALRPKGTAQNLGYGAEQIGEFFLPGGLEKRAGVLAGQALPQLGRAAPALGRIAASALSTGAINKAQGGSFGTGAATGGVFGGLGEAGRAVAPALVESALGITKRLRGFGKTPGMAALEELPGAIRPGTIADKARAKISQLTGQVEQRAAQATNPTSTQAAVNVVDQELAKAVKQNNRNYYDQLQTLRTQLTTDVFTGQPLPGQLPASQLLDLKRGVGALEKAWNPEQRGVARGTVRQVYRALDQELDRAVPGSKELNQRISSLIPVAQRAESVTHGAGIPQRIAGRLTAHTGALAGSGIGGSLGYKEGGIPGAVIGAAAGLALPELLGSPGAQVFGARALRSPVPFRLGRGTALQLTRERDQ